MEVIKQTNPGLTPLWNRFGCRLGVLQWMGQDFTSVRLNPVQYIHISDKLIASGEIGPQLQEWKPSSAPSIFREAFSLMGREDLQGTQVGQIIDGKVTFWPAVRDTTFTYSMFWFGANTYDGHYLGGDRYCQIRYNPNPEVKIYEIKAVYLYRIWRK